MDTTLPTICPNCKHPEMDSAGGNFGGRLTTWKKKCPECGLVLLIIPMSEKYDYTISAMSKEEVEERFKKRNKLRELEKQAEDLRRELSIE